MPHGLFVYGTLHPDRAPEEIRHVTDRFVWLSAGTVMGRLLDLVNYPGLILDSPPIGPVAGQVFSFHPEDLPALDAYEGFQPEAPERSLFVRRKILVRLSEGSTEEHWVYVFGTVPEPRC